MKIIKRILYILCTLIFLGSIGSAVYFYTQFSELKNNPERIAADEARDVIDRVGKLMVLPEEDPAVATIANLEQWKDQPFFAKAKVGDKVLIFTNARRAILYDPALNKIVEVGPFYIGER